METFDFLGFTHICGRARNGGFMLQRHTMRKRMTAKLHEVSAEMQRRRHHTITDQGRWLGAVLWGHCGYTRSKWVLLGCYRSHEARHVVSRTEQWRAPR